MILQQHINRYGYQTRVIVQYAAHLPVLVHRLCLLVLRSLIAQRWHWQLQTSVNFHNFNTLFNS
jgi:uncharacterized protein YhhL (DUF1145 family)